MSGVVSLAERIKVVERVRKSIVPIPGNPPRFKRKRGIYRALERGDFIITSKYQLELGILRITRDFSNQLFGLTNPFSHGEKK